MEPVTIVSIVLASVSLVASIVTPIVVATASLINRIRESDCCFGLGHVELDPSKKTNTEETIERAEAKLEKEKSILDRINNLLKK